MTKITPESLKAAVERHNSIFFNAGLQPVQPAPGQWFCEIYIEQDQIQYGALVEYVGQSEHSIEVSEDGADDIRGPLGDAFILQH